MGHNFGFDTLKMPFAADEWCDADDRMFQACFSILRQYVEDELGSEEDGSTMYRGYRLHSADIEADDPSGMGPRPSCDRQAIDLFLWYRDELPLVEAEYDADLRRCFGRDDTLVTRPTDHPMLVEIVITPTFEPKFSHDHVEVVKDEKLRELIDLRRSLWT